MCLRDFEVLIVFIKPFVLTTNTLLYCSKLCKSNGFPSYRMFMRKTLDICGVSKIYLFYLILFNLPIVLFLFDRGILLIEGGA